MAGKRKVSAAGLKRLQQSGAKVIGRTDPLPESAPAPEVPAQPVQVPASLKEQLVSEIVTQAAAQMSESVKDALASQQPVDPGPPPVMEIEVFDISRDPRTNALERFKFKATYTGE